MSLHRFFCPNLLSTGSVNLIETEAHHLVHVLRHQAGDLVELFDGQGQAATCRISQIRKRDVELEIVSQRLDDLPGTDFTLATAVPKGDRFDWLIEKATELGVRRLIPITTLRSVVDPRTSKLEKLRQTVITACKQSGRNHLMEIAEVTRWQDFVVTVVRTSQCLVAHPSGMALREIVMAETADVRPLAVAIGPEGGFSDDEIDVAVAAGARPVQLGQNILRIETAAIALASKLML